MASSSSSQCPRWNYDIFLSFRGEDTRKTFTSHLYEALKSRGILTYKDDKMLEDGSSFPLELVKAIEESQVAIIIFSRNYASSRWCLDELVKIMKCKDEYGQTVIPVFYDVDPSEVRNQRESYADTLSKHESTCKDDTEGIQKVQRWRTALTAAANLKGYDIRHGTESEIIQQIVDQTSSKLCKSPLSYLQDVVGLNNHLEKLKSLLAIESNDVRMMGIWGMGGVGKTTIARAVFDTLSHRFEATCFLADIKENEKRHQLHSLQNTLLSELSRNKLHYMYNKYDAKLMISSRFRFKKVLIVLDDIDHKDHLDYLAGDLDWFGDGSRVVVTTRDRHLIGKGNAVYEVTALPDQEAMQLFNQHAFKKEQVPDEHFEKLSWEVVDHAKGLPLALKLWGSFLYNRGITEWTSAINQMRNNSNSELVEKLKISYDGLEPIHQEMFLDIACFFRGSEKSYILQILESCNFEARIGLSVLIEKSLVFISNDTIEMHDLIQDMGRYIVNTNKDPGERSRIWLSDDFKEVIINNTGTKAVEAIWIRRPLNNPQVQCFNKEALKNMRNLRLLCVEYIMEDRTNWQDSSIKYLSNNLRWFIYHGYPSESLPDSFEPKRLAVLELQRSSLHQLWTGTKHLWNLRRIDLNHSFNLIRTPDFIGMPNLSILSLAGCSSLVEVHHSLGCCRKLTRVDLKSCGRLEMFACVNVESLEYLGISECYSLEKFPELLGNVNLTLKIDMQFTGIRALPSSIQFQPHMTKLYLSGLKNLITLPSSICKYKSLVRLNVGYCSKLESLPEDIGDLENLEELFAAYTLVSRPPSSIVRLNKLKYLSFARQKSEEYFVFPRVNEGLRSLVHLDLNYCKLTNGGLPEDIGHLYCLEQLYLKGNEFEHLPQSVTKLCALRVLDLADCNMLKELPDFIGMPNLENLNLSNCKDLEEVHHSLEFFKKLTRLELINCKKLKRCPGLCIDSLTNLCLQECSILESFPELFGSMNLELNVDMLYSGGIRELNLRGLKSLVALPSSICKLKTLLRLDMQGCSKLESLPNDIGDLEHLEELNCNYSLISRPPPSIVYLNKLKILSFAKQKSEVDLKDELYFVFPPVAEGLRSLEILQLSYCNIIDGGLPEDIGSLSSLKELHLKGNNFEHLPRSIAQLGALQFLDLTDCERLKEMPELPANIDRLQANFSGEMKEFGLRLSCKDEPQRVAALRENNDESTEHCIRIKRSRYDNSEHHDTVANSRTQITQPRIFKKLFSSWELRH